jgi:hypothetical protein
MSIPSYLLIFIQCEQLYTRATGWTGIWLGMKTAIERVAIFSLTSCTHGKDAHGRFLTIIRNILDNGEAGATVGAIDKWVVIASIIWIEAFA